MMPTFMMRFPFRDVEEETIFHSTGASYILSRDPPTSSRRAESTDQKTIAKWASSLPKRGIGIPACAVPTWATPTTQVPRFWRVDPWLALHFVALYVSESSCPVGTADNSPGLQSWDTADSLRSSPVGTTEVSELPQHSASTGRFNRPYGTEKPGAAPDPSTEVLGYCQSSLRDGYVGFAHDSRTSLHYLGLLSGMVSACRVRAYKLRC